MNNEFLIDSYLSKLDQMEVELSQQEKIELAEIDKLLKDRKQQNDLSTEIWHTIKNAAIDSVEQIIGLNDRGDWRPEQGAVITTPLNFRNGVVASKADKQRYEMWQDRLNGEAPPASEFRQDRSRFKSSFEKAKSAFKDLRRNPDGSYNNDYNETVVFDQNDPRTYDFPDASGDMKRDTTKTINIDHVNSVNKEYKDPNVALYGGATLEKFDQTMRKVCNNDSNFAISDEHANKSMKDRDTLETAENNPELNMNPEKVRAKQVEADKAKYKILVKEAAWEKGKEFAMGVGKSTLAATGKLLVGEMIKIVVNETANEFQKKSEEKILDRVKKNINNIINRVKNELTHIWQKVKQFATANAVSEMTNLILNYFISTVKNIFKLIRCLFGSIISAFKVMIDSSKPWNERMFEALKIISAGIAMATGTMLNELIAKAIVTYIPFLAGFASDISAVVSGLISSILSALILMAFDRYKASIKINDNEYRLQLVNMQLTGNQTALMYVSASKTSLIVKQTTELIKQELVSITTLYKGIERNTLETKDSIKRLHSTNKVIGELKDKIDVVQDKLSKERLESNNNIDKALNRLFEVDYD